MSAWMKKYDDCENPCPYCGEGTTDIITDTLETMEHVGAKDLSTLFTLTRLLLYIIDEEMTRDT